MFELVVLAQKAETEGALEHAASVVPHAPVTLDANSVRQGTRASMLRYTLSNILNLSHKMSLDTRLTGGRLKGTPANDDFTYFSFKIQHCIPYRW